MTLSEKELDILAYEYAGIIPPTNKEEKMEIWMNISDIQKHQFLAFKGGARKILNIINK